MQALMEKVTARAVDTFAPAPQMDFAPSPVAVDSSQPSASGDVDSPTSATLTDTDTPITAQLASVVCLFSLSFSVPSLG